MYCDELGILSLSHMYKCHTLVVTMNKMWSTIKHSSPLNLLELLNECSVKLIYLGQLRFGELKPRPIRPPRPMPSPLESPRANPSTSNFVPTEEDLTVQPNVQINSFKPSEHDACTTSASATTSKGTPTSETEQTSSLSVETIHVEMASDMPSVETRPNSTVNVEMENGRVHVETQITNQNTSHVETNADVPVASQVNVETPDTEQVEPNKTQTDMHKSVSRQSLRLPKTAKLVLEPLKDLKIDVWCRKTSNYYRFVPPMESSMNDTGYSLCDRKPKVSANREKTISVSLRKTKSVDYAPMLDSASEESDEPKKNTPNKTRPKPDGPSTAVLNAHAQIQNKRQKNFETKPVPILPVRNLQTGEPEIGVANVETPSPVEPSTPVETTPTNDSETESYVNTESESENKKPVNGTLVMKTVGIVRRKKKRKAHCKICGNSCKDVKELNQHHRDTHDIVFCPDCNKAFSTRTSLDKHMYVHKAMDYVCDKCGQSFPFESRLKQHKITHRTVATHSCMVKNCGHSFKNTGDLNHHVNQHTGIWYKCDFCTYQNKDKRNTESHQRIHVSGNEKYSCIHCSKKFKFNTQYRHHIASGCELPVTKPERSMSPKF